MGRSGAVLLTVFLCGSLWLAGGGGSMAQDAGTSSHPAIGSWVLESEPELGEMSIRSLLLSSDGTAVAVTAAATGVTGLGVWAPAGDSSASVTIVLVTDGPAYVTVRLGIEIADGGQTLTGTFTLEMVFDPSSAEGTSGEIGPGTLTGTRVTAEGPGTPASSFDDFFAVPAPAATPAG